MDVERIATVIRLPDSRQLGFAEYGAPDGTPVFGFHGTPGSHLQIQPVEDAARELGVRVIAPDRPGYGLSDYHQGRRLLDWPRDVSAIAAYLGLDRFGVFGVSGGGPHSAVCAHALGERLLGCAIVAGVAPFEAGTPDTEALPSNRLISWLAQRAPQLVEPIMGIMTGMLRRFPEASTRQFVKQLPEADRKILARPELLEGFLEEGRRSSRTTARAAAQDFVLFGEPWGFRLEEIAIPVHLWQGDADRNVPETHARRQADLIPDAKLHACPGEGHLLMVDRATEILRATSGRG